MLRKVCYLVLSEELNIPGCFDMLYTPMDLVSILILQGSGATVCLVY